MSLRRIIISLLSAFLTVAGIGIAAPAAHAAAVTITLNACNGTVDKTVYAGATIAANDVVTITTTDAQCRTADVYVGTPSGSATAFTGSGPYNATVTMGASLASPIISVVRNSKVTSILNGSTPTAVDKVTICHRTRATTNPYVLITVSINSVVDVATGLGKGHQDHDTTRTNKVNPIANTSTGSGPFQPTATYPSNQKWWGDIIPPFNYMGTGSNAGVALFGGLNWAGTTPSSTAGPGSSGQWITRANFGAAIGSTTGASACVNSNGSPATAAAALEPAAGALPWQNLYNLLRNNGASAADAFADIMDLEAYDPTSGAAIPVFSSDAPLYEAAFGTPSVLTDAASAVASSSATLNGTLNATAPGGGTWSNYSFNYYTGANPATATTPVNTSVGGSFAAPITGLAPSTTYYYQVVGTVTGGTAAGIYYGEWIPFTTPAASGGGSTPAPAPAVTPISAKDDAYTTPYNTPCVVAAPGVLANDSGSGLRVSSYGQPAHGTVTMNTNGSFTYTPNPGFYGVDTFPYDIVDSSGQTAAANVSITVPAPPAGTPLTNDDAFTGMFDQPIAASVTGNDTFPIGSTYKATSTPAHGTVVMNPDGTFVYRPNPGYSGTDSFTYLACLPAPNESVCSQSTVTLTIAPPATTAAPSANPDVVILPAGSTTPVNFSPFALSTPSAGSSFLPGVDIAGIGSIAWGDSVIIPGQGTWTVKGNGVVFTPAPGFVGTSSISYRVQDATGRWATSTLTAIEPAVPGSSPLAPPYQDAIPAGSQQPVTFEPLLGVTPSSGSTIKPASLAIAPMTSGPWSDQVSVAGKGTFVTANGAVTFTPVPGFLGTAQCRYRVQDATGQWAASTITVVTPPLAASSPVLLPSLRMIPPVNAQPVSVKPVLIGRAALGQSFAPSSVQIGALKGRAWSGALTVPGKGSFAVRKGSVVFTPAAGFTGTLVIKVRVAQRNGVFASSTMTVVGPRPAGVADVNGGR